MREPVIAPNLDTRFGYQPNFLALAGGEEVPLPTLTAQGRKVAAVAEDSTELKYHRFSVVMHKKRRLALFCAANVDWRQSGRLINGKKPTRKDLTGLGEGDIEKWRSDPRIPLTQQLPDVFFTKDGGAFDKGHLIRREDVAYGTSFADMQMGNGDTYHVTNCSPQTGKFNQSARGEDNWGDLENMIQKETKAEKVCLFVGPVLSAGDPVFVGRDHLGEVRVQVPRKFWKVIVANGPDGPAAYGFMLEQDLTDVPTEFAVPDAWRLYLKPISEIEGMLGGLVKLTWLREHDAADTPAGERLAAAARR
jgi:endonuclease G